MFKVFTSLRSFTMAAIQKPEVVFVLGGPGAGKGTLCQYIVKKYGYVHLSAGDLLREERSKPGSQYGDLIESHIVNGSIVPVKITCSLLERAMQQSENPKKRFLIDGFPRNQDNVDGWNKTMENKVILKGVIVCECSMEVCTQRCLNRGAKGSGRSDDNEEVLVKRHESHVKNSVPIIQYYEQQDIVFKINGMVSIEDMCKEADEVLCKIGW